MLLKDVVSSNHILISVDFMGVC